MCWVISQEQKKTSCESYDAFCVKKKVPAGIPVFLSQIMVIFSFSLQEFFLPAGFPEFLQDSCKCRVMPQEWGTRNNDSRSGTGRSSMPKNWHSSD